MKIVVTGNTIVDVVNYNLKIADGIDRKEYFIWFSKLQKPDSLPKIETYF